MLLIFSCNITCKRIQKFSAKFILLHVEKCRSGNIEKQMVSAVKYKNRVSTSPQTTVLRKINYTGHEQKYIYIFNICIYIYLTGQLYLGFKAMQRYILYLQVLFVDGETLWDENFSSQEHKQYFSEQEQESATSRPTLKPVNFQQQTLHILL